MREKQQQAVRRNAQYYKPILNQINIGQWVWIFDPKIIPGSYITGVKRGQAECVENPGNGKLRRREGIKQGLRDITPMSYEE